MKGRVFKINGGMARVYTVEELCNENKQIIIRSQDGIEIGIEPSKEGTSLYFYFGNEVIKRDFDYLVKPRP